jgi:hypothetical protein
MVPNNSTAHLFDFSELVLPMHFIWHSITGHKNTYMLINFQGFSPTYRVIWTSPLFGTLEYFRNLVKPNLIFILDIGV